MFLTIKVSQDWAGGDERGCAKEVKEGAPG